MRVLAGEDYIKYIENQEEVKRFGEYELYILMI